jgi:hypothetical protein
VSLRVLKKFKETSKRRKEKSFSGSKGRGNVSKGLAKDPQGKSVEQEISGLTSGQLRFERTTKASNNKSMGSRKGSAKRSIECEHEQLKN